jgi:hypothetical protein
MILLLSLVTMAVTAGALGITAGVRWLHRRDHRCTVRTKPDCAECTAVRLGRARGGHMICACGSSSLHLTGIELLNWRAGHQSDPLPATGDTGGSSQRPWSTTRVHAAAEAEASAFVAMLDDLGEAERRAIAKARRKPDPITPQLLREAERRSRPRDEQATEAGTGEAGIADPDEV